MAKTVKKIFCILIILICTALEINPVFSQEKSEKKTVRVAVGVNNALYLNKDGKPEGYCAEYLEQLAALENWKLEYVSGSWTDSVQNLYDGKIDILLPAQKTQSRIDTMAFSDYVAGYQPIGLYAKDGADIYYSDYENFNNKKIAISLGTSNKEKLDNFYKEHGITYIPVEINATQDKINALISGQVDMIAFSTFNDVPGGKIVEILDYLPYYYCTRINDTELMSELNDGMRQIMANYPELSEKQYADSIKTSDIVSYSREENNAIANTDRIVFGMYGEALPLSGEDDKGNPVGIYVDLLNMLEEKSGIKIEIEMVDRTENIYDLLKKGKIDFVIGTKNMATISEDYDKISLSDSIMDYTTVAVTMADYQLENAENTKFALTDSRKYWQDYVYQNYKGAKIKYYKNAKECMIAVQKGEADATLINSWEYNYQSKNARFENMIEWENVRLGSDLVVSSNALMDPVIFSIVNKAFGRITQKEKEDIVAKNVNMTYYSYNMSDKLYAMRNTLMLISLIAVILILSFVFYIVMKKKNDEKLKEKNHELEFANKAKSDFLSRMSHELRTPLNAMMGYSSLMKENICSGEINSDFLVQNIEYTDMASRHLLEIIGDILDIQNIESGKLTITKRKIDAETYIQNILDIVKQESDAKHINFTYERLTQLNDSYMLDGARFQQILLNILRNAVKFTHEGGCVSMTAGIIEQNENTVTIQFVVSDTGIGMDKEFIENKLFSKFAQENQDITSPYDGCGIGLAISKQLVKLMGGDIKCESEKGKGTTFTIDITTEYVKRKRERRRNNQEYLKYDLSGIRILICEDNLMNQDIERKLLEHMNCTVDIAGDGREGLEKFNSSEINYYNMILMDIRMPNMDGLEATARIRELDREDAVTVPILAVSANAFDEDVRKSLEAGMNEHLAKPVDARILYTKINEYCRRSIDNEKKQ